MLHLHRAEPAPTPSSTRSRELLAAPRRRSVRGRGRRRADPRHGAVAHPAAVARLGARRRAADGVCANVAFPSPRRLVGDAVAAASGIDPDDGPVAARAGGLAAAGGRRRAPDEPWLRALAGAPRRRRRRRGSGSRGRGASRPSGTSPTSSTATRCTGRRCVRAWAGGGRRRAPTTRAGRRELWRRLRARIGVPGPAERLERRVRAAAGGARARRPPGAALALRAHAPAGRPPRRPRRARRASRRPPLPPAPVARAVGRGRRRRVRGVTSAAGRPDRGAAREPPARLLGPGRARAAARARRRAAHADHHHPVERRRPRRSSPASRPTSGPTPARRRATPTSAAARPDDRSLAGPRLPRPRPPGRGPARRDPPPPRRRPDARAARRHRHVPGHRDVRAADPRHVRRGRGRPTRTDDALTAELRPPDLRVRLADRSLRQTNPVLGVVAAAARARRRRASPPRRSSTSPTASRSAGASGSTTTTSPALEEWVARERHPLGPRRRAPRAVQARAARAGHLAAGLDRVLLGVTMTEDERRLVGGVLPLDDVDSGAIDLAGRLAELVDRLDARARRARREPKPLDAWAAAIAEAADALTATAPRDAWQRARARAAPRRRRRRGGVAAPSRRRRSALPEVRALLADRLQGRPTRANFRTGHLTVCTLVPMRSVPHRVVCLLGLDDGVFPRKAPRDGDDLMLERPARRRPRRPHARTASCCSTRSWPPATGS